MAKNFPAERNDSTRNWALAIGRLRKGEPADMVTWLRAHLFEQVLPFWNRHGPDESGGLFTCLNDRGDVLSTDKWLWSQWRAVWVFSRIYNQLDPDPRWLELANQIADFCLRCGWDSAAGGWALLVSREGKVLRGCESTYVDAFAIYGLTELYRATGANHLRRAACRTADATLARLQQPYDRIPHFPYPIPPGAKPHGIPMLWSLSFAELGAATGEERYLQAAARLSDEIFRDFHRRDRDVLLEFVRLDGADFPPPQGTAIVPGHVIEDMWFQVHVARHLGRATDRLDDCFRLLLRHLELGWDNSQGGLRLAIDLDGREPVGWAYADTKLWWPHTEALYATLLGWQHTRNPAFLDWYDRVWRICLDHFVDWDNGEWRQKLNRSFAPLHDTVALPVKDPFHLPRSLILQLELLGCPRGE